MDDTAKKKSIFKRWWFWVIIALILIIALSSGNKNNRNNPNNTPNNAANVTNSPTPGTLKNQTTTNNASTGTQNAGTGQTNQGAGAATEDASFKDGMYKIGKDLTEGEYILINSGSLPAYFQVSKDSTGSLESIISNDNFMGDRYITIADGQYLEIRGARGYDSDKAPDLKPVNGKYTEGMYKVGKDIAAGEYKVTPAEGATMSYVEVAKDSKNTLDSIVSNDNFQAEKYITIKDGQYIKLVGCYISTK